MAEGWVLIADADDDVRQSLIGKLKKWCRKCRVADFASTTAARKWLRSDPARGLLLALVQVPSLRHEKPTGAHRNLLRYIRKQAPRAKTLAMSGPRPPEDIAQLFNDSLVDGYTDRAWPDERTKKEVARLLALTRRERPLIVFVDDDKGYLRQFGERLVAWFADHEIVARGNASEAIDELKSKRHGSLELAMVDVMLKPGDDCLEFLRHVKTTFPNARRIAITGQETGRILGAMINESLVDRFIDKGWQQQLIRKEIEGLLRASRSTPAHAQIVEAIRGWIENSPLAPPHKTAYFPGEAPRTLSDVADEIEKQSPFGRRQERIIYKLALGIWNPLRSKGDPTKEEQR